MDALPYLLLLLTIGLAVLAWFRRRKAVLPVLGVGALLFLVAAAHVWEKHAPTERPQTLEQRAESAWAGVSSTVARRIISIPFRRGPSDYAVFRSVRVVWHAAPVADPERPGRTLSDIVVCGEVAGMRGAGMYAAFISSGDYTRLSSQMLDTPIDWSICQGTVILAPPDGSVSW